MKRKNFKELKKERKKEIRFNYYTILGAIIMLFIFYIFFNPLYETTKIDLLIFLALICISPLFVIKRIKSLEDNENEIYMKYKQEDISNIDINDKTIHDADEIIKTNFKDYSCEKDLLDELYNRYVKIEKALCNGELDTIEKLCTNSLYKILSDQYNELVKKGEKHIIEYFVLHSYNIQGIDVENEIISIHMSLHISYKDYYLNQKDEYIKENEEYLTHKQLLLDFVIDKKDITICPNCGSKISGRKCDYCNTVLKEKYKDFTLSKIGLIENKN